MASLESTHEADHGPARARARLRMAAALLLCGGMLAGCGDSMPRLQDLNPFAEKEVPLAGKRIAVI